MIITHRLKDGTQLDDISGHVVKMAEAKAVYALLDKINRETARLKETEERNV